MFFVIAYMCSARKMIIAFFNILPCLVSSLNFTNTLSAFSMFALKTRRFSTSIMLTELMGWFQSNILNLFLNDPVAITQRSHLRSFHLIPFPCLSLCNSSSKSIFNILGKYNCLISI